VKNKIIILLFLIVFLITMTSATALPREKTIHTFEKCDYIYINVTSTLDIDTNEYEFINCSQEKKDYWYCECEDNYELKISFDFKTINNYTLFLDKKPQGTATVDEQYNYGGNGYYFEENDIEPEDDNETIIDDDSDVDSNDDGFFDDIFDEEQKSEITVVVNGMKKNTSYVYSDENANKKTYNILSIIAVIVFLLFVLTSFIRKIRRKKNEK